MVIVVRYISLLLTHSHGAEGGWDDLTIGYGRKEERKKKETRFTCVRSIFWFRFQIRLRLRQLVGFKGMPC